MHGGMHGGVRMPLQVDTATRERSLESQLQLARRHLGTAEQQAGAQAEPASHDKDAPANSIAEELAQVCPSDRSPTDAPPLSPASHRPPPACAQARAAIEEQKSVASHWMRSCKQAACPAGRMGRRLTQRTCHMHGPSRVAPPNLGTGAGRRAEAGRRVGRAQHCPPLAPLLVHVGHVRAAGRHTGWGHRGSVGRVAIGLNCPQGRALAGEVQAWWYVHGMCMACAWHAQAGRAAAQASRGAGCRA